VTIWYQTYFNPYTQCIQIVPAFTPNPGPPAGAPSAGGTKNAGNNLINIPNDEITIAGTTTMIKANAAITANGASASISGAGTTITYGKTTFTGATLNINNGTAQITAPQVTIVGGTAAINNGITTVTGGTATINNCSVTITGDITISKGSVAFPGGPSPPTSLGGTLTITGATTEINPATINIAGGTLIITGAGNLGPNKITFKAATASIIGGTTTIQGNTATIKDGAVSLIADSGNQQPTQDITKDPNVPGATANPDSITIQWDASFGGVPADKIDVEFHVYYLGREGVYRASSITRSGNSYTVPLKQFGDSVMKQILLTNCYDLCGPIYLDCAASVVVYPYFLTTTQIPGGAPSLIYEKSGVGVPVMNALPILIQPKAFSGPL
jgi:hypothetical protein